MSLSDNLPFVNAEAATQAAFAALDGIQQMPAAQQVAGVFLLATVMANQAGLSVRGEIEHAERRERDGDTFYRREIKALRDYVNKEIA